MMTARLTPAEYTVERLAEQLAKAGEITEVQRRQIVMQSKPVEQRLIKAQATSVGSRALHTSVTPPEVVASMHLTAADGLPLDEDRIMQTVSRLAGLPYHKVDPLRLDHPLITETLTRAFARRHVCLPVSKDERGITFAVDNPFDQDLLHQLTQLVSGKVVFVVSAKRDILRIIAEIYGFRHSIQAAERDISRGVDLTNLEQLVRLKNINDLEANDKHVVNAVEYLLHYAYDQRASDIHMEPIRDQARLRMRIDGVLHELFRVPDVVHRAMVSRIKTLARMDIAERRRPQDGRIKTAIGDAEVQTELRVSSMPVAFGEKVVIRIFDPGKLLLELEELGMREEQMALYEDFLSRRHGMVLVTGPTGSGKTTTLYSTLHRLASPDVNIVTVEDPIEMVHDAFNQVQVQRKIDLHFASALRNILRQDPDIIMVGEIRDGETAQMAVQAALTGHLVFSTLHTNDTAGAITRLQDLGVPNFLISSTLIGCVAQRLVRLVCERCAVTIDLTPAQAAALEIEVPPGSATRLPVRAGEGCPRCRDTGLYGRQAVFEVLPITESIREILRADGDAMQIFRAARADGLVTLRESSIRLLAEGKTTFAEVLRVVGTN